MKPYVVIYVLCNIIVWLHGNEMQNVYFIKYVYQNGSEYGTIKLVRVTDELNSFVSM